MLRNKQSLTQQGLFSTGSHYNIEMLKIEHIDEVINLFTKTFCEYEPMTKYLCIDALQFRPFAEKVIKKAALDGLSIVACDGKKVVACAIVEDIANPINLEFSDIDPKFQYIFGLLENLSSHFFEKKIFNKNNLSHLFITAVDVNHHGCGLSKRVNVAAMKLSRDNQFDFMCCEFTNYLNERGTVRFIEQKKALIGSCCYKDFVMDEMKPFEHLDGSANAYLWELRPEAKLTYYHIDNGRDKVISHGFEEELRDISDLFSKGKSSSL